MTPEEAHEVITLREHLEQRFDDLEKRFDAQDKRLEHIEEFLLLDVVVEQGPKGPGTEEVLPDRRAPIDGQLLHGFPGEACARRSCQQ